MLIRCERCSTVYELDETMLAPEGAPVQCTRCENVFVAYPPRAAGRTLVGVPAVQAPAAPAAAAAQAARQAPLSRPTPGPRAPVGDRARTSSPQVYRPTTPPTPPVRPTPVIRKDQMGAFESRLRWSARWRWLAPALAAAVAAAAVAAWLLLSDRADPQATRARAEGLALLSLDDAESVERAVARLGEAARLEPKREQTRADGALARIVRAEGLREEWEDAHPAEATPAADPGDPRLAKAKMLVDAARTDLDGIGRDRTTHPAVLRARAVLHAYAGERQKVLELAAVARGQGERDPWLDLAEATVDLAGPADARDRGVVRLVSLAAAHPELVRARWLLARGQASLGRTTEALAAIEAVLAANGRHDGARRLRERLTAPPPAPPEPAPPVAAPPEPPRRRPRNEALAPATPELTTSPATEIRPLGEDAPLEPRDGQPPRSQPLPPQPASEPEPAPRP